MALYPDIQDRVIAEIDNVYAAAAAEGRSELTYGEDFEKLVYTYAFMVRISGQDELRTDKRS